MKNYVKLLGVLCFLIICNSLFAQTSRNYSVLTWADVSESPASITIHFEDDPLAISYQIYRKDLGASGWGSQITTMAGGSSGDLSYKDVNVAANKSYEYFVWKIGNGSFRGYGYTNVGIKMDAQHSKGTLLLVIDKEAFDSLGSDLDVLRTDLSGDGYRVIDYVVDRDVKHETIKEQIATTKNLYTDLNSVYIFGHVAVPYSGKYCNDATWSVPPDGHRAGVGDHCGAWAADVYYAVPGGNWTDNDTVDFGASRSWNKNAVGDGKFDQIVVEGDAEYELGRVDLYNMPAFAKGEFDLLRQYIDKCHNYRHVIKKPYMRSIIDENFNPSTEAFAGNGYRNFAAMVGRDNIVDDKDYMDVMSDSTYIWAYCTGPGSFTSAGGIGKTTDYVSKNGAATFNFVFGSFFGDWDNRDNFLRAPLAVDNGGLTNAWAGRPWWHTHPMAYNRSIGYCTRLVQNNNQDYQTGFFAKNIHIALMGDPTLRMHMFEPPINLVGTPSSDKRKVDLSWTASTASIDGYNVYVSSSPYGTYGKVNATLITGTSYTHNSPGNGTFYYMVRAQRLETTLSGSFQNLSQGQMVKVDNLLMSSVEDVITQVQNINLFPNPSNGSVQISFESQHSDMTNISIVDVHGRIVYSTEIKGIGEQLAQLDLQDLSKGLYTAQINGRSLKFILQ